MRIRALSPIQHDYPARLLKLRRPPDPIYVRGELATAGPSVAIVGSRVATEKARRLARELAAQVAIAGVRVVSGGALGIDAAAHQGALDGGGATTVVLPGPVDRPTPRSHHRLFGAIHEAGGAFVSELREPPRHAGAFCARNRIIAALCDVVLVVQASRRSGTRYTVRAARQIDVPVAAVPWDVDDPRAEGCRDVLRGGGAPVTGAGDLLRLLQVSAPALAPDSSVPADARQRRIFEVLVALGGVARAGDLLAGVDFEAEQALASLTLLDLDGWVTAEPSGVFTVGPRGRSRRRYFVRS